MPISWNEAPDESWRKICEESGNPLLDPFHLQVDYAETLMEFWHDMFLRDQK